VLKEHQDAFGREIYDYFKDAGDETIIEIVERDDGYIDAYGGVGTYFSEYKDWPLPYKKAMKYARGRVLDIGCGAGRCSLYLQGRGMDAVGIDNSPLAIEVCKQRGLKNARVISINRISKSLGIFDTIIMMGNNFGLFGSFEDARRLLRKMHDMTSEKARIIAESNDVYKTNEPDHLGYHEFNRKRGRMAGQIRLRVRRGKYVTPWFDYLMVSREEMEDIVRGTGWEIKKIIESNRSPYIAVMEKTGQKK
jgi:SAM-dependent methyltransferase